jgi:hypothetical protein
MKKIILVDLDGTLANCSHRLHHIQNKPKDWRSFFAASGADEPIVHLIDFIGMLDRSKVDIWITSGRSDECRPQTEEWLKEHGVVADRIIMRRSGDFTDDGILKPSWLTDGTIPCDRVLLALDDRSRVVKAWREAGVPCLQVAEGDF